MQLSDTIKITRQKAFLSQEAFAKELKVAVSTINRWENGKSKPNLTAMKNLKIFCTKYELPYEELEKKWFAFGKEENNNG
jgi:DNA-binding transcriptional regulator YiaG